MELQKGIILHRHLVISVTLFEKDNAIFGQVNFYFQIVPNKKSFDQNQSREFYTNRQL